MKARNEWPKMQLVDSPKVMPEMKTVKNQETEIITCEAVQANQPHTVVRPSQSVISTGWRLSPTRFSNWSRLIHVHARVRRVLHNMSKRGEKQTSKALSPQEIREAEEEVVLSCQ